MLFCLFHDLLSSPISQHSVWSEIILIFYSLLYHSLEWLHQCNKCILQDYGITFLFHDRRATTNTGLRTARSTGHASVEWVMGCYLTPDSVAAMAHFSAQNG